MNELVIFCENAETHCPNILELMTGMNGVNGFVKKVHFYIKSRW